MSYKYQHETTLIHNSIPENSVARQSNHLGMMQCEPIIVILDGLLRYARAYEKRYEAPISNELPLCENFIDALKGVRAMLSWYGAIALERNINTDSKDNGACEQLFWYAVKAAGLKESDLNL